MRAQKTLSASIDYRLSSVHLRAQEHPDENILFVCRTEQAAQDAALRFRSLFGDHYGGVERAKALMHAPHKGRVEFVGLDFVNGYRISHIFSDEVTAEELREVKVPAGSSYDDRYCSGVRS